jgi:hypothetical protein
MPPSPACNTATPAQALNSLGSGNTCTSSGIGSPSTIRARRPLRVSRLTRYPQLSGLSEPTTDHTLVEAEPGREFAERHLVLLERRDGIDGFPNRSRDRRVDFLSNRSATSLRTTA